MKTVSISLILISLSSSPSFAGGSGPSNNGSTGGGNAASKNFQTTRINDDGTTTIFAPKFTNPTGHGDEFLSAKSQLDGVCQLYGFSRVLTAGAPKNALIVQDECNENENVSIVPGGTVGGFVKSGPIIKEITCSNSADRGNIHLDKDKPSTNYASMLADDDGSVTIVKPEIMYAGALYSFAMHSDGKYLCQMFGFVKETEGSRHSETAQTAVKTVGFKGDFSFITPGVFPAPAFTQDEAVDSIMCNTPINKESTVTTQGAGKCSTSLDYAHNLNSGIDEPNANESILEQCVKLGGSYLGTCTDNFKKARTHSSFSDEQETPMFWTETSVTTQQNFLADQSLDAVEACTKAGGKYQDCVNNVQCDGQPKHNQIPQGEQGGQHQQAGQPVQHDQYEQQPTQHQGAPANGNTQTNEGTGQCSTYTSVRHDFTASGVVAKQQALQECVDGGGSYFGDCSNNLKQDGNEANTWFATKTYFRGTMSIDALKNCTDAGGQYFECANNVRCN